MGTESGSEEEKRKMKRVGMEATDEGKDRSGEHDAKVRNKETRR